MSASLAIAYIAGGIGIYMGANVIARTLFVPKDDINAKIQTIYNDACAKDRVNYAPPGLIAPGPLKVARYNVTGTYSLESNSGHVVSWIATQPDGQVESMMALVRPDGKILSDIDHSAYPFTKEEVNASYGTNVVDSCVLADGYLKTMVRTDHNWFYPGKGKYPADLQFS